MIINDRLYGKYKITSPALLALINSKSLKRLKGIAQYGVPDEYYHLKNYTRFEHCIGVMLFLERLGASEEESIAGLLHDVSHTAFSHVIDWVVGEGKTENYQDEQHERFVRSSEIPKILQKYGYDPARILNYHNFRLLEQDLPELCADRVDYSLREFPPKVAKKCVEKLVVFDGKIVFGNRAAALTFAVNFLKIQRNHWGGFEAASRYRIFADVLRLALKKGIIIKNDFWQNDAFIIRKLRSSNNQEIHRLLNALKNKTLSHLPKSKTVVYKKFRFVDPLFIVNNKLARLSKVDSNFLFELKKARQNNDRGVMIPLI